MEKFKIGIWLTLVFALVVLASNKIVLIPGITGIRPADALPIVYGLLFGQVGAFACGVGAVLGDVAGGTANAVTVSKFLGAFAAASIPYRVWQGMSSSREPQLIVKDTRTGVMFFILALLSAVPGSIMLPLFADHLGIVAYTEAFGKIIVNAVVFAVVLGGIIYKYVAPKCIEGDWQKFWLAAKDTKSTTRGMSIAILRITLTALFIGVGFKFLMPAEMGQTIVMYVMGILSLVLLVLIRV